ncbi:hypothetical protein [Micromonospora sp. HUAS LYJ1]|uniref:hypothetical protein n=1 Tax=Micromonospora sp. HUAS LYJ1 TaxID=3061626 RepID=UPI0026728254|nr:hypothetical protein [Micromonospora sp. HUAS LYJ1]WKU04021.1 hypothetical protein Q2K16_24775 [Micromonospora sp. HUAS LYJ1]
MPSRMRLVGYRPDPPVGDAFTVTGFGGAGFPEQATLRDLVTPAQPYLAGTGMVRGDQRRRHSYWLRYLRRRGGPTGPKRVCVDLLVRFTTFDYVAADVGAGPASSRQAALVSFPCWGVADLSVSPHAVTGGRNPFNKFNEVGSLVFTARLEAGHGTMPAVRVGYRVHHERTTVDGVPLTPEHDEVGSFLVHSDGLFEVADRSLATRTHFLVTPVDAGVHDRPPVPPADARRPGGARPVWHATGLTAAPAELAAPRLTPYADDTVVVTGFDGLDGPQTLTVRDAAGEQRTAMLDAAAPEPGALLLAYRADRGPGRAGGVRLLLGLRFTMHRFLVAPAGVDRGSVHRPPEDDDAHVDAYYGDDPTANREAWPVLWHRGRRHTGLRQVALLVSGTDGGPGPDAVRNSTGAWTRLVLSPDWEPGGDDHPPRLRIGWHVSYRDDTVPVEGRLAFDVDAAGRPTLTPLDDESRRRFTVTG